MHDERKGDARHRGLGNRDTARSIARRSGIVHRLRFRPPCISYSRFPCIAVSCGLCIAVSKPPCIAVLNAPRYVE